MSIRDGSYLGFLFRCYSDPVNVALRDQNIQNIVVGMIDDIEDQVLKERLLHLKESMEMKRKERDKHDPDGE